MLIENNVVVIAADVSETPLCATCPTERPAVARYRIRPRRDVPPISDDARRATAWPGAAAPVWVPQCGGKSCFDAVRGAATAILASETLGDAVVRRTVS